MAFIQNTHFNNYITNINGKLWSINYFKNSVDETEMRRRYLEMCSFQSELYEIMEANITNLIEQTKAHEIFSHLWKNAFLIFATSLLLLLETTSTILTFQVEILYYLNMNFFKYPSVEMCKITNDFKYFRTFPFIHRSSGGFRLLLHLHLIINKTLLVALRWCKHNAIVNFIALRT